MPFFQFNIDAGFIDELESCPFHSDLQLITTSCRGISPEDDFLYVTDSSGLHDNGGKYTFYRLNLG